MGFRFHRSIKIFPGIRLNISKKGLGVSAGVKGYRVSVGPAGGRRTVSIPGTGISKIDQISLPHQQVSQPPGQEPSFSPPSHSAANEEPLFSSNSIIETENNLPNWISPKLSYTCVIGIIVIACSVMLLAFLSTLPQKDPEKSSSLSVDQVVSTMMAKETENAVVTQLFAYLTQTSQANAAIAEQTRIASIPTAVVVTNTPFQPLPSAVPTIVRAFSLPTAAPLPTAYIPPLVAPIPLTGDQNLNVEPTQPTSGGCCRHCVTTKACGDGCIKKSYTCHKPPGCACNG